MTSERSSGAAARRGRDETVEEQADRKWDDVLQELRVMQTGTQLIAGFLLTLPFQDRFADLDRFQESLYLGLVVTALVTTAVVMAPLAAHRRLEGRRVKDRLVGAGGRAVQVVLALVALLVVGMADFILDVVVGRVAGLVVAGAMLALLVVLLVVVPRRLASNL